MCVDCGLTRCCCSWAVAKFFEGRPSWTKITVQGLAQERPIRVQVQTGEGFDTLDDIFTIWRYAV